MITYLKFLALALFSNKKLQAIYDRYRDAMRERDTRVPFTFCLTMFMAIFLLSFLFSYALNTTTLESFIADQSDMELIAVPKVSIASTKPVSGKSTCAMPNQCYAMLRKVPKDVQLVLGENAPLSFPDSILNQQLVHEVAYTLYEFRFRKVDVSKFAKEQEVVLHFGSLRFERLDLYWEGKLLRSFYQHERVVITLPLAVFNNEEQVFEAVVEAESINSPRFNYGDSDFFVATHKGFSKFVTYVDYTLATNSLQVGMIARIVLAIFILLFYLTIEASPESLGLALTFGLEACGMVLGNVGLEHQWIKSEHTAIYALKYYMYFMSDVMRLYFFMQLARVAHQRIAPWLIVGSVIALPYAVFVAIYDYDWIKYIWASREIFVCGFGIILCLRQATFLRGKKIPWRVTALWVASFAAVPQLTHGLVQFETFDWMQDLTYYGSYMSIMNSGAAYLFALSTFINISTLKNRVQVLSAEKVKAREIEKELELGRSVQQAFLNVPTLPNDLKIAIHYEAAVFVSGDTYYVNWSAERRRLTFLLNDVTGHGIQAALKAFACTVIAKSIWESANDRRSRDNFAQFEKQIEQFLNPQDLGKTFNAMVGVEFNEATGLARLYRSNHNFPIYIEAAIPHPQAETSWHARVLTLANRTLTDVLLNPNAMLVLCSDGIVSGSHDQLKLINHLNKYLSQLSGPITSETIKDEILGWTRTPHIRPADDRTLMVFHWTPRTAA
jgi:hypothetical protein